MLGVTVELAVSVTEILAEAVSEVERLGVADIVADVLGVLDAVKDIEGDGGIGVSIMVPV